MNQQQINKLAAVFMELIDSDIASLHMRRVLKLVVNNERTGSLPNLSTKGGTAHDRHVAQEEDRMKANDMVLKSYRLKK